MQPHSALMPPHADPAAPCRPPPPPAPSCLLMQPLQPHTAPCKQTCTSNLERRPADAATSSATISAKDEGISTLQTKGSQPKNGNPNSHVRRVQCFDETLWTTLRYPYPGDLPVLYLHFCTHSIVFSTLWLTHILALFKTPKTLCPRLLASHSGPCCAAACPLLFIPMHAPAHSKRFSIIFFL